MVIDIHEKLIKDFYDSIDRSIQKDVGDIKGECLKYLLTIFKGQRDKMQREGVVLCLELEGKMNNKNFNSLKMYLNNRIDVLNRLVNYNYPDGYRYEYYQGKLDWYILTSHRVNGFVRYLNNISNKCTKKS